MLKIRIYKYPKSSTTRLLDLGAILIGGSPAEFPGYLAQESAKWRDVIRERGIKLQ